MIVETVRGDDKRGRLRGRDGERERVRGGTERGLREGEGVMEGKERGDWEGGRWKERGREGD